MTYLSGRQDDARKPPCNTSQVAILQEHSVNLCVIDGHYFHVRIAPCPSRWMTLYVLGSIQKRCSRVSVKPVEGTFHPDEVSNQNFLDKRPEPNSMTSVKLDTRSGRFRS